MNSLHIGLIDIFDDLIICEEATLTFVDKQGCRGIGVHTDRKQWTPWFDLRLISSAYLIMLCSGLLWR